MRLPIPATEGSSAHAGTHDTERFSGPGAGRPSLPELRRRQRPDRGVRLAVLPAVRRLSATTWAGRLAAGPRPVDARGPAAALLVPNRGPVRRARAPSGWGRPDRSRRRRDAGRDRGRLLVRVPG